MTKKITDINLFIRSISVIIFLMLIWNISFSQVTISQIQDLKFGSFYPVGSGGSITINTSGQRSATSNIVLFPSSEISAAEFDVKGGSGSWFVTSISINNTTLYRSGGGGSLSLTNFTYTPSPWFTIRNRTVRIRVGARLNAGSISTNPAGNYNGTFNFTINYF